MKQPFFFGYGSLVNRATHIYGESAPAMALGWRRAWVHTPDRPQAFLTAVRAPGHRIEGLIASVPGGDWIALDERETGYDRISDTGNVRHALENVAGVSIYAVPPEASAGMKELHPILLSYLDVVLQGYLREFGRDGAERFVATTDGWEAPVLDDREAPLYPRHQRLDRSDTAFVDEMLDSLGSDILKA